MRRHVPYLAEEAIERDAAALLAEFEHARGIVLAPPIPVEDIVEKHLKLRIEFDDLHARHKLPRPENGQTHISAPSTATVASLSTKPSTPMRTRRAKAAIASPWRTNAVTGGSIST